jgi:formylmethanofuran dehydrogenase subunit B
MTWQTGYPSAVSLSRGYPRFGPRDFAVADVLERAECDAALIVAGDPLSRLTPAAREHLDRIPTIVLHCRDTATAAIATVALRTATYGINTPGTVYRADGVPISLRPALPSPLPSDEEMLKRIEGDLRELQAANIATKIDAHI